MQNLIKIWSIQNRRSLISLRKNGYIRCNEDKCGMLIFYSKGEKHIDNQSKKAYDWLVEKMKDKIGTPPEGVKYPIWGWYNYTGSSDSIVENYVKDSWGRIGRNRRRQVAYELELPKERVCLTDYDDWHFPLNNWYLGESTNEKEWESEFDWVESLGPNEKEEEIRKSWDKIFDWETKRNNDCHRRGLYTQATFWEIRKEDIVNIHEINWR